MTITLNAVFDECGNRAKLARQLKLTRQAVSMWKRVPVQHVHAVCKISGGKFTPEQLRPDVYRTAA
jgi:DNA-binding transcriptional regulator YdaS (Cro superfamily)